MSFINNMVLIQEAYIKTKILAAVSLYYKRVLISSLNISYFSFIYQIYATVYLVSIYAHTLQICKFVKAYT